MPTKEPEMLQDVFTMQQNSTAAVAPPRTLLGRLQRSPYSLGDFR